MPITSKQIAELANVSRGTVDRALNNRGGVRPEVSLRIKKIAEELGYVPNSAASALAKSNRETPVGIVMPASGNIHIEDIKSGFLDIAEEYAEYGITFLFKYVKSGEPAQQIEAMDALITQGVKGILITPSDDAEVIQKITTLTENNIPVITFHTDISYGKRLCYIGHNYFKSGATAEGLLAAFTSKSAKVAVIKGSKSELGQDLRIKGFLHNREKFGHNIEIVKILDNTEDDIESYLATKNLMLQFPQTDAIFLTGSGVYGCSKALKELNLAEKIIVIASNDLPQTLELLIEGVVNATICESSYEQGYISAKILCNYLTKKIYPESDKFLIPVDIKIRENI